MITDDDYVAASQWEIYTPATQTTDDRRQAADGRLQTTAEQTVAKKIPHEKCRSKNTVAG